MRRITMLFSLLALVCLLGPASVQAQPYLGEVRLVSFNFAPKGWAMCAGQLLPINQNQALFSLLGTTYGGNGVTTFALPDFRGRVGLSFGQGPGLGSYSLGERGGQESHTLTLAELPAHTHVMLADSTPGSSPSPENLLPARNGAAVPHYGVSPSASLAPNAVANTGGSQPHENRPPSLVMNYIIALQGIFPSHNSPQLANPQGTKNRRAPQAAKPR